MKASGRLNVYLNEAALRGVEGGRLQSFASVILLEGRINVQNT